MLGKVNVVEPVLVRLRVVCVRLSRWLRYAVVLCVMLSIFVDNVNAASPLDSYIAHLQTLERIEFTGSKRAWLTSKLTGEHRLVDQSTFSFRKVGGKWKIEMAKDYVSVQDGTLVDRHRNWELVAPGEGWLFCSSNTKKAGDNHPASAALFESDSEIGIRYCEDFRIMFGYDLLNNSYLPDAMEPGKEFNTLVGDRVGGGNFTAVLDESIAGRPISFRFHYNADGDQPDESVEELENQMWPNAPHTFTAIVNLEYGDETASRIPRKIVTTTTFDYSYGGSRTFEEEVVFENIVRNPIADGSDHFTLSRNLVNGHEVQVEDSPNIEYVWQDGKIVRSIDQLAKDSMASGEFMAYSATRRWVLVSNALLLIAVVVMLGLRTRSSRSNSS